jgi:hypothetical protein
VVQIADTNVLSRLWGKYRHTGINLVLERYVLTTFGGGDTDRAPTLSTAHLLHGRL